MKKLLLIIIIIAVIVAALWFSNHKPATMAKTQPVNVEVTAIKKKTFPMQIAVVGTLYAQKAVTITPEISGTITHSYFKSGDLVKRGDMLFKLDDASYKATLASKIASWHATNLKLQRYKKLRRLNSISQQSIDDESAQAAIDKAAIAVARANLAKTQLLVPFNGKLGVINVNVGSYIKPGDSLVQLVNTQQLKAVYHIPGEYYPQLKVGQTVEVVSDAYPEKTFTGKVTFVSPIIAKDANTITVQALINNKDHFLTAGMYVKIKQLLGYQKNAIVVPASSLVNTISGEKIYVVRNNKVKAVFVKVLSQNSQGAIIQGAVKVGESVIVAGQQRIHDGSSVKTTPTTL